MTQSHDDIPSLLHDATLIHVDWQSELRSLRLCFRCLMRNMDGSDHSDPVVELRLEGVERIAAYHSPANLEVRPSEFPAPQPWTAADLVHWERSPCEAHLSFNSRHDDFRMATSCQQDWLFGDGAESGASDTAIGIHLIIDARSYAQDAVVTALYCQCDSVQAWMAGLPLSVDQWRQQFDAWWRGWQEHWDRQESEPAEDQHQPEPEDKFIPVGEDLPPDLSYRPPSKPAFAVESTDAPAELLEPIRNFHESVLQRDWRKLASVYPQFDQTPTDRAEELGELYLSHDFGRWVYVRQIDSWWAEGARASVVIRGIEHVMPDEEDPAINHETVVTYGLLNSGNQWIISSWSQGWPQYGSAPQASGRCSWRDEWDLSS